MIEQDRINETKIEDFIFIVYYFIITLSLYANKVERAYFTYHNQKDKLKYRNLLYLIFGIAFLVYLYYVYDGIKTLRENRYSDRETKYLNELSLLASILVLTSGIIYLYIISKDENISVELAFN